MKTYGTVKIAGNAWEIQCAPHVRMKLKRVFAKVNKGSFDSISLRMNPESARDLDWFMERYPMEMEPRVRKLLKDTTRDYVARLASLEALVAPDYVGRAFPLSKPMRHYQSAAVEVHDRTGGLLVADDLGLGKSVTAMGTLTLRKHLPALIVCPVHLVKQWLRFLGEFLPLLNPHAIKEGSPYHLPDCDVYVISYSKLSGWGDVLGDGRIKQIIFDEIQDLRHSETKKYAAAAAIRAGAIAAMGLSATPIFNYGGEIFNIMDIIAPGKMGDRDEFYREWCHALGNGKYLIEDTVAFGEYLRDEFLMLRRRRSDVGLELPAVERSVMTVAHNAEALKKVEAAAENLARMIFEGEFEQTGEAARQFDMKLRMATGVAKAPHVSEFVKMILESGEKVLLFGWHRDVYDVWMEELKEFHPVLYTGSESTLMKADALNAFIRGRSKVMIMSLRSGVGVDGIQQACRIAVFGELDWSPGVHEQCIGRLNRDGVGAGVLAYFLVSEGGSDPFVSRTLGLKSAQHRGIVDLAKDADEGDDVMAKQATAGRVKEMARAYLEKKGIAIPERKPAEVVG